MPVEIWADIPGHANYQASNYGEVRSLGHWTAQRGRWGCTARHFYPGRILTQAYPAEDRYAHVSVGRTRRIVVHRAVLLAFEGSRPEGKECAHGPAGRRDNSWANLSYKTKIENNGADKLRDGTDLRGEKSPLAKLTEADVREIRRLWESEAHLPRLGNRWHASTRQWTLRALAGKFKIDPSTVAEVIQGKRWSHVR